MLMFPRAVLACIREGRQPHPDEVACVTDKVLREAFAPLRLRDPHRAAAIAYVALLGDVAMSVTTP